MRAGEVTAIAAGYYHSIVLTVNGDVFTTGGNEYGQLGDGTSGSENSKNRFTKVVGTLTVRFKGSGYSAGIRARVRG